MTERKPDYVFNVLADGELHKSSCPELTAEAWSRDNNHSRSLGFPDICITHRIRVYLKNKDDKK